MLFCKNQKLKEEIKWKDEIIQGLQEALTKEHEEKVNLSIEVRQLKDEIDQMEKEIDQLKQEVILPYGCKYTRHKRRRKGRHER